MSVGGTMQSAVLKGSLFGLTLSIWVMLGASW